MRRLDESQFGKSRRARLLFRNEDGPQDKPRYNFSNQNRNYNLLALASIIAWLLVALPLGAAFKIKIVHGGSITSTAADGHILLILTESADFAVAPCSLGVEGEPCSCFSEL